MYIMLDTSHVTCGGGSIVVWKLFSSEATGNLDKAVGKIDGAKYRGKVLEAAEDFRLDRRTTTLNIYRI